MGSVGFPIINKASLLAKALWFSMLFLTMQLQNNKVALKSGCGESQRASGGPEALGLSETLFIAHRIYSRLSLLLVG